MAENTQLEAFLSGGSEPAPTPAETPPPVPVESTPKPEAPEASPAAPAPKPDDDDAEPPEAREGEPVVPRRALEDERHKRQNYVAQAAKYEAERDMLAKQLEELKKAQTAPQQPPQQMQPINPAEDPAGYHARVQGALLNERLNMSEMLLRKELGAEKVDAAVAEFRQHAEREPTLYAKLYQQPDPYGWMAKEVDRLRLINEVTTDPAGYEAKLRAKWEAEANGGGNGQAAPRVSPAAGLPPSLANVRSALPRSSAAYTGPQSLDDILGQRATHNTRH